MEATVSKPPASVVKVHLAPEKCGSRESVVSYDVNESSLPPVSLIVCAYNAEKDIRGTLDSLLAQTHQNIEILVVDDGSTDSTPKICRDYAVRDGRVRIVTHPRNLGLAHGRNTGLEQARHDLLTFIDADDVAMPQMVQRLAETLLADDSLLGVSAYRVYFDDNRDLGVQKIGPTSRAAYMQLYARKKLIFLSYPNLVHRRDVLRAGGYRVDILGDPEGPRHADLCEDLDLWCRMADLSADGRYFLTLTEPLSKYRKPADSMSTKNLHHMQNKMRWIKDCLLKRRAGHSELTYAEFLAGQTHFDRLRNAREDFAASFYKKAGFAFSQRQFVVMAVYLALASIASPGFVFDKLRSQSVSL